MSSILKRLKSRRTCSGGFTMVEVIVVISIAAVVSATAVPAFYKWSNSMQYRGAAVGIASELQLGRERAVTINRETRVELDLDGRRYRLTSGDLPSGSSIWTVVKAWEGFGSEVVWATGPGCDGAADTEIRFRPNGSSGGGTVCIKDGAGAERFRVVVSSISGRVRVES